MLPRAFSRTTDTQGYINEEHNMIVVNASSRGKAEDFLTLLRKSLGSLPVTSMSPERAPDEVMTDWINDNSLIKDFALGDKFSLGMHAEFHSLGDNSPIAIVKNQDLKGDEVKAHLDNDKYVTKIALEYDDTMSFMLNDDLSIKQIKFFDVITEQNDDFDKDDVSGKLIADFTLMVGELNLMLSNLYAEFSVNPADYLQD